MSLWNKVQILPPPYIQKVQNLYGDHFPIEVRYSLADWIEKHILTNIELDVDNPDHEVYIKQFVSAFLNELEGKANSIVEDPYLSKIKLFQALQTFKQRYTVEPFHLYRFLKYAINCETHLVEQAEKSSTQQQQSQDIFDTLTTQIGSQPMIQNNDLLTNTTTAINSSFNQSTAAGNQNNMMFDGSMIGTVSGGSSIDDQMNSSVEISEKLKLIKSKTQETGEFIRRLELDQEAFAIKCHDRQKMEGLIQIHRMQSNPPTEQSVAFERNIQTQKERLDAELKHRVQFLMKLKQEIEDKITITINEINTLQSRILDDELTKWKREQQLSGNGSPLINNLDQLQSWCEDLAELIWSNRFQLKELERLKFILNGGNGGQFNTSPGGANSTNFNFNSPNSNDKLVGLQEKVTQLLSSLVTSTFIVEKQPPQVMKTNTRFTSTVRLLVGGRLNIHMTPPQVNVNIISEMQANSLLRNEGLNNGSKDSKSNLIESNSSNATSGEIINNRGTMEYHQATRHLSVHFRNMQLKKIKRTEKKGQECVMDEKFCLHFQCQFTVGEKELIFKIWTLSLPVVVIVHGNQEPHAWATVTWDNAFGEPGRLPFQVPERVHWSLIGQALNIKFKSLTGRGLTVDNLKYLAEKAFRVGSNANASQTEFLTWSQFCKEPLPDKNFTFWEWFYANMKLTREHLRGPWVDGLIIGFISKKKAEDCVEICQKGTFLLRFSDSELGGITIAAVGNDQKVYSIAPFTSRDLTTRGLADRIADLNPQLTFFYPDINKDQALAKYFSQQETTASSQNNPNNPKGPYVNTQLKTQLVVGDNNNPFITDQNSSTLNSPCPSIFSNPSTPHNNGMMYPNSPLNNMASGMHTNSMESKIHQGSAYPSNSNSSSWGQVNSFNEDSSMSQASYSNNHFSNTTGEGIDALEELWENYPGYKEQYDDEFFDLNFSIDNVSNNNPTSSINSNTNSSNSENFKSFGDIKMEK